MGKSKTSGKGRLDKFYYLAKEQGYRSRAAFKLVQLNRKYQFLENSRSLLDLCAAPGGWLQVAAKYMPVGSVIVGVDLVPIRAVPGCITLTHDITTPKCRAHLKQVLKGGLLDVVVHDGSPNVGGAWLSEALGQAALSLQALRLAVEFLKPGGTFISKVFRSQDYNALLFALKQLFGRVEATKPVASRATSAEIYVVCHAFKAPSRIDPRLLDAKHLFETVPEPPKAVDVLAEPKSKRSRDGYEEGQSVVHKRASLADFLTTDNAVAFLGTFHEITFDLPFAQPVMDHPLTTPESKARTATGMKVDALGDTDIAADDELFALAAIKRKQLSGVDDTEAPDAEEMAAMEREESDEEEEDVEEGSDDDDSDAEKRRYDAELEAYFETAYEHYCKATASSKRRTARARLMALEGQEEDGQEDAGAQGEEGGEEEAAVVHIGEEGEEEENPLLVRLGESSASERVQAQWFTQDLFEGLDLEGEAVEEPQDGTKASGAGGGAKTGGAVPLTAGRKGGEGPAKGGKEEKQRGEKKARKASERVAEREEGKEEGEVEGEEGEVAYVDDGRVMCVAGDGGDGEAARKSKLGKVKDAHTETAVPRATAAGGEEDGEKGTVKRERAGKQEEEEAGFEVVPEERLSGSEGDSSDDSSDSDSGSDSDSDSRGGAHGGHRGGRHARTGGGGAAGGHGGGAMGEEEEEWDSDSKAETLAYARRMLRKRERDELVDDAYNRYMFDDDAHALPKWFADDERRHMVALKPISKDEVLELKAQFRAINARPTNKVAEAKGRKRRRLMKQLEAARQKATAISEQADLTERAKGRLMQRAYSKVASERPAKKIVVVAKKGQQGNRGRGVKNSIMVDRRMKKDLRAEKANARKGKGRKVSVMAALSSVALSNVVPSAGSCVAQIFPAVKGASNFSGSSFVGGNINLKAVTKRQSPAFVTSRPNHVVAKVSVGDEAPPLSLTDQNGRVFDLAKLKGRKSVVLYFYPADDTPGCTKQACSFRDSFEEFRKLGAEVVGISGDSPESHKLFAEKYSLPFTLLYDEGNAVRKEWGVPSDLFGVLPGRQTYVIDKKGVVQLIFNNQFQPEKHIDETIAVLEAQYEEPKPFFQFPKLF
ncbi:unnamed protein product [Closterium sp. Yama58-4]|nr:unnamed protein product [Closterium sp. Yama58-4]